MARFLAGVASALLLVAAGFFLWRGLAHDGTTVLPPLPAAFAGSLPAAAGPDAAPQASEATREEKRFARYDHDRDGKVSREEYLAARRKGFARLDLDHDGKLSFEEYAAKAEAKYAAADKDRSGTLDADEFAATKAVRKANPRCPPAQAQPAASASSGDGDEG